MTKIKVQAPTRIGIMGGGTDVDPYASKYGGACLSLAINLYQTISLDDEDLSISIPEGANEKFYKAFSGDIGKKYGLTATFSEKIGTGLGSSASAAVALVKALTFLKGEELTPHEKAEVAWNVEFNELGLYGGKQDQYAASFGGMNLFEFNADGVTVYPVEQQTANFLSEHIVLIDTEEKRISPKIQEQMKILTPAKIQSLNQIKVNTYWALQYIADKDIQSLGKLLDDTWELKKKSNPLMTTPTIDALYEKAKENGALGGKLMGSGGGGCMFFLCPLNKVSKLKKAMKKSRCRVIEFEPDFNGVEVIS